MKIHNWKVIMDDIKSNLSEGEVPVLDVTLCSGTIIYECVCKFLEDPAARSTHTAFESDVLVFSAPDSTPIYSEISNVESVTFHNYL